MLLLQVTCRGQRSFEVNYLYFQLTIFKYLLHSQMKSNCNQTWVIGALGEPLCYATVAGHMSRSKVISGQLLILPVDHFQIPPAGTDEVQLQPNLGHRCTRGTFMFMLLLQVTCRGQRSFEVNFLNILSVDHFQIPPAGTDES